MPKNMKLSSAAASAAADAVAALLADGYLRIYDGEQPASADTPVGERKLLAELRWGSPAFSVAEDGVASAKRMVSEHSAKATGKATWFRALRSDGKTVVFDGSVGRQGSNINIKPDVIQEGAEVTLTGFSYAQSKV